MLKRDVIVIGTSAGGLEALKTLIAGLPPDLPAAVLIVWHMPPDHPNLLPQILNRHCTLHVTEACNGDIIKHGQVYVAAPDHHLVLEPIESAAMGRVRVAHGPTENRFRPSVDVLFRSAARAYGGRVIGVVLTGMLDDGASGLYAVKECGGLAVVQNPVDALYPDMPINAMKAVKVDHNVPMDEMAGLLTRLVGEPLYEITATQGSEVSKRMDTEVRIALEDNALEIGVLEMGQPSLYTCPECHGVLMQLKEGPIMRFRCHTGHAYSINALLSTITKTTEDTLWSALRAVEESEILMGRMAQHLRDNNELDAAEFLLQKAEQARHRAGLVRQAVLSHENINTQVVDPQSMHRG